MLFAGGPLLFVVLLLLDSCLQVTVCCLLSGADLSIAVWCSLFADCCDDCLLRFLLMCMLFCVCCCVLCVASCLLFVVFSLLVVVFCLLSADWRLLCVVCWLLCAVCSLLPVVDCFFLRVVRCLAFGVCRVSFVCYVVC